MEVVKIFKKRFQMVTLQQLAQQLNIMWTLIAGIIVFIMQIGFAFLETGMVRYKNTINVGVKNLIDILSGILAFWLVGYSLMFGKDYYGVIGELHFKLFEDQNYIEMARFFFQAMFAATATTIISGALAERIQFKAYSIISMVLAVFIFPIIGHWVWVGWLHNLGFHDFAGATVVHSVGAWVGLAGTCILGPRLGRFSNKKHLFTPSNYNFIVFGTFFLLLGWFGYTGGSALMWKENIPLIFLNTILGAIGGGAAAVFINLLIKKNMDIILVSFGIIGGLVSISGGADIFSPGEAFFVGLGSGMVLYLGMKLLERLKVDDPVNVIATHGIVGFYGTLMTGVLGHLPDLGLQGLDLDRWSFIKIQLLGGVVVFVYSILIGLLVFSILKKLGWLRVSKKHEVLGLNITEHNAKLPWIDIIETIIKIQRTGNLKLRVPAEHGSEAGVVANFINNLLVELEQREEVLERLATTDQLTKAFNRLAFEKILETSTLSRQKYTVGVIDIDKFKLINDTYGHPVGDEALKELARLVQEELSGNDALVRWGGEEFIIFMPDRSLKEGALFLEKLRKKVEKHQFPVFKKMTISGGVASTQFTNDDFERVFKRADDALYQAKQNGRNQIWVDNFGRKLPLPKFLELTEKAPKKGTSAHYPSFR
jgi:Amt family ammonium transporter